MQPSYIILEMNSEEKNKITEEEKRKQIEEMWAKYEQSKHSDSDDENDIFYLLDNID